jgi:cold shock CspA family protein
LVELAVHIVDTASKVLESNNSMKQKAKEITDSWESDPLFIKCAQYRRNTSRHFIYNKLLEYYFPLVSSSFLEGKTEGVPYQGEYIGTIEKIVYRSQNPFGFISTKEQGQIYFNNQSLLNIDDWDILKEDTRVRFDIVKEKKPLRHRAVRLSIDSLPSDK